MKQKFETQLPARGPNNAWTKIEIPFDVAKVFGSKARVPIAGTMNGFAFRTSLLPNGDGTHHMSVSKELMAGAKAGQGDVVKLVMEVDKAERVVEVPPELQAAAAFNGFSYTCRKEYADWIASAKRPETKAARLEKAITMLNAGQKMAR